MLPGSLVARRSRFAAPVHVAPAAAWIAWRLAGVLHGGPSGGVESAFAALSPASPRLSLGSPLALAPRGRGWEFRVGVDGEREPLAGRARAGAAGGGGFCRDSYRLRVPRRVRPREPREKPHIIPRASAGLLDTANTAMKRTYQPSRVRRRRNHGFRARMRTRSGRGVIRRRRSKGRRNLVVKPSGK